MSREAVPNTESEGRERNRSARIAELKEYLAKYLELRPGQDAAVLRFERAADLPADYAEQYLFLGDARLADMEIVVVPDELWHKGQQPSESAADKGMILVREGYYRDTTKERQDETAWMTHELAHLQRSLDLGPEAYDRAQSAGYPDNPVEEHAFRRQFEYLRSRGASRDQVADLLRRDYGPDEFRFLDRVLDRVFRSEL